MCKATTAIVSLLFVACVCVFAQPVSAPLAATGIIPALFLILLTTAGVGWRQGQQWGRWVVRHAAPGLLVLLSPALLCGTTFLGVVNTFSTGSLTLTGPFDVAVDSLGNVYIADTDNSRVVEVTAAGVASVVSFPGLSPALSTPSAVAVDGLGNLYVADSNIPRVIELSGGVASVVATGSLLSSPDGLALDASGNLYIADGTNNYIVKVPAGGAAAVLAITGLGGTALNQPFGLAVDVSGNLYIADAQNSRIVKVTPGGAGTPLTISGGLTLSLPLGVAVDGLGNVYIADDIHNRIVIVAPGGSASVLNVASGAFLNPRGVAVGVLGAIYIADTGHSQVVEAQPSTVGFGHLPSGALSGTTLTLPFSVANGTVLSSVQAFTLGTSALDFTVVAGSGTTCVAGTTGAQSCTVQIQFLPTAPGLRRGAVVLYNNATPPVPILSVPLYATSDAPLATLSPGAPSVINTGGVVTSFPFQTALDGAGDIYVADYEGSNVVKVTAGGGSATVVNTGGFTLSLVAGVALDGAGNLFIADHGNSRIVEVTAGGVASVLNITGLSTALSLPVALAEDAAGNLYIADWENGRIVKVTPAGAGSVLATGSYTLVSGSVIGVAVDAAGTVYIADRDNNRVLKVTASGAASLVVPAGITPVLNNPQGVGVDAFGNIYIADSGNNRVVEVTTADVASVVQMPGLASPSTIGDPFGVSVDSAGNVLIPDFSNSRIVKVNVAGATLAFPNTNVSSASAPQTATVTNLGDLPLVFAASPAYTPDFSQPTAATNQCLISASLAPGTVCDVSVEFTPQSAASLSASILLTNNNLNVSNATESVAVSGTGLFAGDTTAVTVSTNPASVILGRPITVTAIVTDTAAGHTATVPTGGVTFMDTVGSTGISLNGGSAVALNGTGMATLTGVTLSGAGLHTITANYVGVASTFLASSNTTTIPVAAGPITPTINWTPASATITYGATLSGILNASAVSGLTAVAGSFAYTATPQGGSATAVTSATVLGAGSYTLTATFTPADTTTYASTSASVSLTVVKATPAVTLTPSASVVTVMSAVTFTATVSSSAGTPSGSVSFFDGTTLLGTGTLNSSGVATFTTSSLGAGADSITAVYLGNAGYAASTSSAVSETVTTAYTVTAPARPVLVAPGGSVNINITVPPLGGAFDSAVTLSASGLPPGATATFNPPTVTPGSTGAQTVMTIQLATLAASVPARGIPGHKRLPVAPFSLGLALFGAVFGRKRIPRTLMLALALAGLGVTTSLLTGCGGGFANTPQTQAGNYTVTVIGTSGSFQASTTVTLTVE